MGQYKTCSRCKQSLEKSVFSFRKAAKDKLTSWCRPCMAENAKLIRQSNLEKARAMSREFYRNNKTERLQATRSWRMRNKTKTSEYQKSWRSSNPKRLQHYSYMHGSRRRSRESGARRFEITNKELKLLRSKPCVYCGSTKTIELDHILPLSRGGEHRIGNLAPSCQKCNRQKNAKTVMEWKLWKSRL